MSEDTQMAEERYMSQCRRCRKRIEECPGKDIWHNDYCALTLKPPVADPVTGNPKVEINQRFELCRYANPEGECSSYGPKDLQFRYDNPIDQIFRTSFDIFGLAMENSILLVESMIDACLPPRQPDTLCLKCDHHAMKSRQPGMSDIWYLHYCLTNPAERRYSRHNVPYDHCRYHNKGNCVSFKKAETT